MKKQKESKITTIMTARGGCSEMLTRGRPHIHRVFGDWFVSTGTASWTAIGRAQAFCDKLNKKYGEE